MKDSDRGSEMTSSCKWPLNIAEHAGTINANCLCGSHPSLDTVKTRIQEPSDLRTYRLNFDIWIPKNIRTCSVWQRKIGSYTKISLQVWWSKFWILMVPGNFQQKVMCICFLWFTFVWIFTRNVDELKSKISISFFQWLYFDNLWEIRTY